MKYLLLSLLPLLGSAQTNQDYITAGGTFEFTFDSISYSIVIMDDGDPCPGGQNFQYLTNAEENAVGDDLCYAIYEDLVKPQHINSVYYGSPGAAVKYFPGGCWIDPDNNNMVFSGKTVDDGVPAKHLEGYPAHLYCIQTAVDGVDIVPGCMDVRYEEYNIDATTDSAGACATLRCDVEQVTETGCLTHDQGTGVVLSVMSEQECGNQDETTRWCINHVNVGTFDIDHNDHSYSIEVMGVDDTTNLPLTCPAGQSFLEVASAGSGLCQSIQGLDNIVASAVFKNETFWSPGGCWVSTTTSNTGSVVFSSYTVNGSPAPPLGHLLHVYCITAVDGVDIVPGCMDVRYTQYNPAATVDDGSCATLKCAQPTCVCDTPAEYIDAQCCAC